MFSYASLLRERFSLRLNEDELKFSYYNSMVRKWDDIGNNSLASHSAIIRGLYDGRKVIISSRRQVEQNVILIHLGQMQAVGAIRIKDDGALMVANKPTFQFRHTLPEYWQHRTTLLLGVTAACTINLRDLQADDEDILRLKANVDRWFVPARYVEPTAPYDIQTSERELVKTVAGIGIEKGVVRLAMLVEAKDETAEVKDETVYEQCHDEQQNVSDDGQDQVKEMVDEEKSQATGNTDPERLTDEQFDGIGQPLPKVEHKLAEHLPA